MQMIVSPYHLTRRDPAVMAALLCARRVVTLLPTPIEQVGLAARGAKSVESSARRASRVAFAAANEVPTFRAVVESWAWTQQLWDARVLVSHIDADSPTTDLFAVGDRIERDERLSPLRRLVHAQFYEDDRRHLDALAADLLKGGSDPGVSVPVAAAIDRFAARRRLFSVRAHATSMVEKAELALASPQAAAVVPIFVQASAARLLRARAVLSDVLAAWWKAADQWHEQLVVGGDVSAGREQVQRLAGQFAAAFAARRDALFEGAADDEVQAIDGAASFSWLRLPPDAVITSGLAALAAFSGVNAASGLSTASAVKGGRTPVGARGGVARGVRTASKAGSPVEARANDKVAGGLPVVYEEGEGASVTALVVKALGGSVRRSGS